MRCPRTTERRPAQLLVDDEAEIRDMLTEILTGARHRVVAVGSGREALQRLAAGLYDVIFTDMRMPDLDGRALYREIELRWPDQAERVVFVTGDTLTANLRTSSMIPSDGYRKPFLRATWTGRREMTVDCSAALRSALRMRAVRSDADLTDDAVGEPHEAGAAAGPAAIAERRAEAKAYRQRHFRKTAMPPMQSIRVADAMSSIPAHGRD